jgi:predicted aconitase with swiveling domain
MVILQIADGFVGEEEEFEGIFVSHSHPLSGNPLRGKIKLLIHPSNS